MVKLKTHSYFLGVSKLLTNQSGTPVMICGLSFPLPTMSEDQQVWSQVFYWVNYENKPTMEWPQAKYITYTKFIDKYQ